MTSYCSISKHSPAPEHAYTALTKNLYTGSMPQPLSYHLLQLGRVDGVKRKTAEHHRGVCRSEGEIRQTETFSKSRTSLNEWEYNKLWEYNVVMRAGFRNAGILHKPG